MALQPWRTGKVIAVKEEIPFTRRFWIQVPELTQFDFMPGQFVTLDLPIHEKPSKRWRSYSIASWPDGTNVFELVIVLLENGAGTTYLFNEIKEGSELVFRGAQGIFTLPEKIEKDLFLVCTGTGIAPFRSMVQYIHLHNTSHKNIYLLFGCRTQKDLLYFDELNELQNKLPGFKYIPSLSREQWTGKSGYVHSLYEEIVNGAGTQVNENGLMVPLPASFYLCGWKNMIDEARQRITALGFDKKAIHLELYG